MFCSVFCSSAGMSGWLIERLLLHQRQEHVGQADAARALGHAGVAGDAAQHAVGLEDLLDPAAAQHVDDAAGRELHVLAVGAGAGARAALDAGQDAFAFGGLEEGLERGALMLQFGFEHDGHGRILWC